MNHKKPFRLYREEKLSVCERGGRTRATSTRSPTRLPNGPNQRRWWIRRCQANSSAAKLNGSRKVEAYPMIIVSDKSTEISSNASLAQTVGAVTGRAAAERIHRKFERLVPGRMAQRASVTKSAGLNYVPRQPHCRDARSFRPTRR